MITEKEKKTFENVHKKLSYAMQDAYINDMFEEIKEPNLDLSFLKEGKTSKRKYGKFARFGTIAAVTIIVLLGANIVLLSSENMVSYGDKGILHRLYVSINGIFTDESDEQPNDIVSSLEIVSEDDYDKAKEYFPQLYIPNYITSGYELELLYIEKYNLGDVISIYNYSSSSGDIIEITCTYCQTDDYEYEYKGSGEIIKLDDRTLYLEWDDTMNQYFLTIYTESCNMSIYVENCTDKSEIIKIGKNMRL